MTPIQRMLWNLLPAFTGYTYGSGRYPWALNGVTLKLAPPKTTNCVCFSEALVVGAKQRLDPSFLWSLAKHNQWMINGSDMFGPITVAIETGLARPLVGVPEPYTLISSWNLTYTSGHTYIIVDRDPATDRVLMLESNVIEGWSGVGFRGLGKIGVSSAWLPGDWWKTCAVPTWAALAKNRNWKGCVLL